jgi:hypothetical protein
MIFWSRMVRYTLATLSIGVGQGAAARIVGISAGIAPVIFPDMPHHIP